MEKFASRYCASNPNQVQPSEHLVPTCSTCLLLSLFNLIGTVHKSKKSVLVAYKQVDIHYVAYISVSKDERLRETRYYRTKCSVKLNASGSITTTPPLLVRCYMINKVFAHEIKMSAKSMNE